MTQPCRSEAWDCSYPFDFIHTRVTMGCFSDFKNQIVRQAFDNLEPGGWFESLDLMPVWHSDDGTLDPKGAFGRWIKDINEASERINRPLEVANKLKGWYEEVGFVDVHEEVYKMPSSGWPTDPKWKGIGQLWQYNLLDGLSGFTLGLFSKAFGRTEEEIHVSA